MSIPFARFHMRLAEYRQKLSDAVTRGLPTTELEARLDEIMKHGFNR